MPVLEYISSAIHFVILFSIIPTERIAQDTGNLDQVLRRDRPKPGQRGPTQKKIIQMQDLFLLSKVFDFPTRPCRQAFEFFV